MINKYLLGSAFTASLILSGCGSSGSDTTTTVTESTTGYVVDAAVENLNYDCVADNAMDKVTGKDGAFTCQNMSQVRFRIGNLVLGEISALPSDKYVFPQDLAGVPRSNVTDDKATAIAQLLQSLDTDENLDNGIQLPQNTETQFDDDMFDPSALNTYTQQASLAQVRTRTQAQQHVRETMQALNATVDRVPFDINNYPVTETLSEELKETIAYMGNEERLAYDVYMNLYNYHMDQGVEIKQLFNIADKAETQHIAIVQSLVHRYELDGATLLPEAPVADSTVTLPDMPSGEYAIPAIQALYDDLTTTGKISKQAALEAGCKVEVTDVNDLNGDIQLAIDEGAEDVLAAYNVLRDGSYNHYWAFDKGLKNMGIADGCCSLGSDFCHPEYPQNENGNQDGQNRP